VKKATYRIGAVGHVVGSRSDIWHPGLRSKRDWTNGRCLEPHADIPDPEWIFSDGQNLRCRPRFLSNSTFEFAFHEHNVFHDRSCCRAGVSSIEVDRLLRPTILKTKLAPSRNVVTIFALPIPSEDRVELLKGESLDGIVFMDIDHDGSQGHRHLKRVV